MLTSANVSGKLTRFATLSVRLGSAAVPGRQIIEGRLQLAVDSLSIHLHCDGRHSIPVLHLPKLSADAGPAAGG